MQNEKDALLQQHAAELASKQKAHEQQVRELMNKAEEDAQRLQQRLQEDAGRLEDAHAHAHAALQASILKSPVYSQFHAVKILGH
jgi:hypothetical protein